MKPFIKFKESWTELHWLLKEAKYYVDNVDNYEQRVLDWANNWK